MKGHVTWYAGLLLRTIVLMIIFSQYLDQAWVPVPNNMKCRWSKKYKYNCKWQSPPYQRFCQIPLVRHVPRPSHHLDHVDPLRNPHTGADCICLLVLVVLLVFILVLVSVVFVLGKPSRGKSEVFLNIVQKAFAPPPLLFEHLSYFAGGVFSCGEFFKWCPPLYNGQNELPTFKMLYKCRF